MYNSNNVKYCLIFILRYVCETSFDRVFSEVWKSKSKRTNKRKRLIYGGKCGIMVKNEGNGIVIG